MRRCRSSCSARSAAWPPPASSACSSARTLLALGYQIFMGWVATNPDAPRAHPEGGRVPGRLNRCRPSRRSGCADARARPARSRASRARAWSGPTSSAPRCRGSTAGPRRAAVADGSEEAAACRSAADRRVVAQLRRPGARGAGGGGPAPQSRRAHRGHAHPRGARAARDRRQRALPATAAGSTARACASERRGANGPIATSGPAPSGSTSAGSWTSGASSGAASSRRTPAISPASRSTTICRCWSRRRPRSSTPRFAPSNCGCGSRTRTPRCRSAASRSPSGCSAAATSPSSTCSRPRTLYLSTLATIPELEGSLRQTQNALGVLLARPPGPLPEMEAGARADSRGGTRDHRRRCPPTCCAVGPTCARPSCRWPRSRR